MMMAIKTYHVAVSGLSSELILVEQRLCYVEREFIIRLSQDEIP